MPTLTRAEAADLFRRPADRHITVGNGQVAVRSVGTGPDVLFVHGWPVSGATFRGLLPHLSPHLRCHVLDLAGAGDSRFGPDSRFGIGDHAAAVRQVVDAMGLGDVAVVGHDSGGLIARHALAGDPRVRSWGLIDTEQPQGPSFRFRSFLAIRVVPRFENLLAYLVNQPRIRRNKLVLGDCFTDRDLLDGEFAEFFLRPLQQDAARRRAAGDFGRQFDLGAFAALTDGRTILDLAEGLQLRRARVMGANRIELTGFTDTMRDRLRAYGLFTEIISWKLRFFVPVDTTGPVVLAKLLDTYPVARIIEREAA